jgi:hypothetical protein
MSDVDGWFRMLRHYLPLNDNTLMSVGLFLTPAKHIGPECFMYWLVYSTSQVCHIRAKITSNASLQQLGNTIYSFFSLVEMRGFS